MKKNLEVVALGLGLMGLALGVGCDQQEARADDVPTYVQVEAPKKQEAKPDQPTPAAQPAENPPAATVVAAATVPVPTAGIPTNLPATATVPDDLKTSPALTELIRLLQGGVSEEVLTAYITNSTEPFYVGADEILFLHDLGTPAPIITTLIQRDSAPDMVARKQAAASTKPLPPGIALNKPATNIYTTAAPPAPNPPEPTPVNPPEAAPAPPAENVAYTAPPEPANVSYFYSELAPYGIWVDVVGYGRCWRPTVAVWNASWRPYRDCGRWLWTDAGWYWYSDYSWGWAPFHYGRWTCPAGVGWVWAPDTCWGPSWVSWRYSSSYCGWAPLPPSALWVAGRGFCHNNISVGIGFEFGLHSSDYVFVSNGGLCARRPIYLSASHSTTVFKDTTVVNNYVTVNNAKVMNKGVGFDRISHATRGNIRQVALKDTTDVRPTTPRRETLDADGGSLTVSRPPLASPNSSSTRDKSAAPFAVRPRTERNVATVSPKNPSTTTSSGSEPTSSQFTGGSGTVSPRGTYVSPRTSPSSARPSSVTTTPVAKPEGNSASANPTAPRTSTPIRGTYARGGRPDAPTVAGGDSTPNNSSRPTVIRPEPSRNYTQPGPSPSRGNAVRGGGDSIQARPPSSSVGVPPPSPSAPRSAPSYTQPSARPSIPSSPRVEGYRAPVAPPAAARSAPSTSSGGGHSSGGGARSGGGGDSGGRSSSSSSSSSPSSGGGGRGNR